MWAVFLLLFVPLFALPLLVVLGASFATHWSSVLPSGFTTAHYEAATRGEAGQPAAAIWVAVALLIPVCLALGNIYRTVDWPKDAGPIELAVGSHLASAAMLFAGILAHDGGASLGQLAAVPLVTIAQMASASLMFVFFFRLQHVGGPVYLSQIGYVAAAVGLFSGTLFLGERYGILTWLGAAIIVAGVYLTTKAQSPRN